MNLNQWAIKWAIPFAAVEDLRREFGMISVTPINGTGLSSESLVQSAIRLEASKKGLLLMRNNVGVARDKTGRPVRYGLCNDSKKLNKLVKSSDLIGIRPVCITPAHVGQIIGQFVAREVKEEGWQYTGDEHERAQLNFLNIVTSRGGDAQFATGEGTL